RSPCPMLNTLANHGFLSRTGRNISKEMFNQAQVTALNMSPELASKTTNAMVAKLGSPINESESFDLNDFAAHGATEHDASLTRLDINQGSVVDVNPGLIHLMLADSKGPWLDPKSIARSRVRREEESLAIGSLPLSSAFVSFAQLEASFLILIFGYRECQDALDLLKAPKERIREWLIEERFPIEKGF
ncbi:Chloroperoxidase, partial [Calycina marina]